MKANDDLRDRMSELESLVSDMRVKCAKVHLAIDVAASRLTKIDTELAAIHREAAAIGATQVETQRS